MLSVDNQSASASRKWRRTTNAGLATRVNIVRAERNAAGEGEMCQLSQQPTGGKNLLFVVLVFVKFIGSSDFNIGGKSLPGKHRGVEVRATSEGGRGRPTYCCPRDC